MKKKNIKVTAVVEFEFDPGSVDDSDKIAEELIGEVVKVKSGFYENIGIGWVVKAEKR